MYGRYAMVLQDRKIPFCQMHAVGGIDRIIECTARGKKLRRRLPVFCQAGIDFRFGFGEMQMDASAALFDFLTETL